MQPGVIAVAVLGKFYLIMLSLQFQA